MKKILIILGLCLGYATLFGQGGSTASSTHNDKVINEMKLNLNEEGTHYLKWTFLNQVWLRYNQSNPGTLVLGDPASETFDIGLRRTRIQFYGQLTDHVFFYMQFGQNNFNYLSGQNASSSGNRKLQAFFHDALGEYKVWKENDQLFLGGGLAITNGLSRFSQPSIGTIMTMDVPVFAQATVDQTDEFSRKLSVYARGQLGKLDYRVVLSDPFPITSNGQPAPPLSPNATFSQVGHHKQFQGLFIFNFFDKESHTTPYMTGTYLGKKKVFNLEAGFISQKNATWSRESAASDTSFHSINLWSVALYYDAPLNKEKGTALSAYAGFFNYNFGQGYLRYNGIMNPADGTSIPGAIGGSQGNAYPMFGTGQVIYAQIGYLMKKDLLGEAHGTLMPYASLMSADYDRLSGRMNVFDLGVNWLMKGHSSKLTLDYQLRPVYEPQGNDLVKTTQASQVVLQYQIFF
jgi:hypothetical protein